MIRLFPTLIGSAVVFVEDEVLMLCKHHVTKLCVKLKQSS